MKKILIIGELNQLVGNLNQHLAGKFQTQMCMDSLDMVKAMTKVFRLDMAVVCLGSEKDLDSAVLDYFRSNNFKRPVLLVGTAQECERYASYYESPQFDFVARPTTLGFLQRKCEEMLKIAEQESAEDGAAETPEQSRKCILAVDDSGILLRSVKSMLDSKYDVCVANSGKVALSQAKKKAPDLILLDYEMPDWDGKRTLEEIRNDETLKDTPVVFLTAVADKAHIAAVLELKPSGYLLKPIEQQTLFDSIEKAMIKI